MLLRKMEVLKETETKKDLGVFKTTYGKCMAQVETGGNKAMKLDVGSIDKRESNFSLINKLKR